MASVIPETAHRRHKHKGRVPKLIDQEVSSRIRPFIPSAGPPSSRPETRRGPEVPSRGPTKGPDIATNLALPLTLPPFAWPFPLQVPLAVPLAGVGSQLVFPERRPAVASARSRPVVCPAAVKRVSRRRKAAVFPAAPAMSCGFLPHGDSTGIMYVSRVLRTGARHQAALHAARLKLPWAGSPRDRRG